MGACYIEGCEPKDDEDVTYFPFPVKPTLRRKWRVALNSTCKLPAWGAVCSRHFREDDTQLVRGKLRLRGQVVPTLRLKNPSKSRSTTASPVQEKQNDKEGSDKEDNNSESNSKEDKIVAEEEHREPCPVLEDNNESDDGAEKCTIECAPSAILPSDSDGEMSSELHNDNDIEDIIANYHIKQDQALRDRLRADVVRMENSSDGGSAPEARASRKTATDRVAPPPPASMTSLSDVAMTSQDDDVIELEDEVSTAPEYIEIAVENGAKSPNDGAGDCLMVLESVQVDIDPATLMFDQQDHNDRNEDPISLLTSSDDDDVIIEEPHVDTVEVSDETDEDDVPLVKLVQSDKKSAISDKYKEKIGSILWGSLYEYYCFECKFVTTTHGEYVKHKKHHSKVMEMCTFCDFSTASKGQFYRHMKKHKAEKRHKCPKCQYRARHHMSLVYHMKSHDIGYDETIILGNKKTRYAYRCSHCKANKFKSNNKREMLDHVKVCGKKKYECKYCEFRTNKERSLKLHIERKHEEEADDDFD